jgi:winged helix DNA-binding protein
MRRQLLDPVGSGSVVDVVERLGAVPAWPDTAAELAIGARRRGGRSGDAARALAAGEVVKVFAFRGATHLMTPRDAGAYLAVRASSRMWELPSWRSYYRLEPPDWPRFREYVREALAEGPLTRSELVAALARSSRYRHLSTIIAEGNETLLKPLTWQGDLGLGPVRDGEPTFLRLDGVPGWAGIPGPDEAGSSVVVAYLHVYGPATRETILDWVGTGLGARRRAVTRWLAQLDEQCEEVTVDGERLLVLTDDVDDLRAAPASAAVRLLPGRDPWVMAPGTSDTRVVPPDRREVVSRSANLVVSHGALAGTWALRGERLHVSWFAESGRVPRSALEEETVALARFLGRPLDPVVELA